MRLESSKSKVENGEVVASACARRASLAPGFGAVFHAGSGDDTSRSPTSQLAFHLAHQGVMKRGWHARPKRSP